ncbi:MAG TPA: hypothetical protein VN027_19335, partial [Isoptericola sp.]|nr:hypothetical protein [Isoptericola sp.]
MTGDAAGETTGAVTGEAGAPPGRLARALAVLRSPWVRWGFLALALGLAVYAVVAAGDDLARAAAELSWQRLAVALVLSVAFVLCTFASWRVVLADLGAPTSLRVALRVFGLSQLGKYVPGGVWNVVAAAELGVDHGIARRTSVT